MCRVLGQDFLPYLQVVIGPLTTLAGAKADIQLIEDDEQIAQIEQNEAWEIVPLKGKVIGIKTSTLDDKHTAIELIKQHTRQFAKRQMTWFNKDKEIVWADPLREDVVTLSDRLLNLSPGV